MHPDALTLAAYLDGALPDEQRAAVRAHVLTCAACTGRLERLRADARRISTTLTSAGPTPDVRAAVRARLRRPPPAAWLGQGLALAGALAALLLLAIMLGARPGATLAHTPDRLFVTDRLGGRIVALDARNGMRLQVADLGPAPTSIRYDPIGDRLYVMLRDAIVAVDPHTLRALDRWIAPRVLDTQKGMALDARGARLYVALPEGIAVLALDAPELRLVETIGVDGAPSALAVAPDGRTVYALVPEQARLWTIVPDGAARRATSVELTAPSSRTMGWIALDRDGASVYVLLTGSPDGRPLLWRLGRDGRVPEPVRLEELPLPWDMEMLDTGQLAIPRGDGVKGGVELVDGQTLTTTARLDPQRDEHHITVGPDGAAFALNFTGAFVTRFDARAGAIAWRTDGSADWQPWDAAYVPGGWRWPF